MPPQQLPRITLTPPTPGSTRTLFPDTPQLGESSLERKSSTWHLGFNYTTQPTPFVLPSGYSNYEYYRLSNADDDFMVQSRGGKSPTSRFPCNKLQAVVEEREEDQKEGGEDDREKEEDKEPEDGGEEEKEEKWEKEDEEAVGEARQRTQQHCIGPACDSPSSVAFRSKTSAVRKCKKPRRETWWRGCIPPWPFSVFSRQRARAVEKGNLS